MNPYKHLFEPGRIGKMETRNRLVMPSMSTLANGAGQGYITERYKAYLEERARGGLGLVMAESACVDARAVKSANRLRIDDDRFIPGLSELVEVVHRHGAKVAIQLNHAGRTIPSRFSGYQPMGPSPIPAPGVETPHELTVAEIADVVDRFAKAAERARRAGFDAVEIHGGHTNLIRQFLTPSANQRRDDYGGSWKNRARFMLEIVRATRKAIGPDFPFWCRINSEEKEPVDHIPMAELLELAAMLQDAGASAINVSGVPYARPYFSDCPYFVRAASAVKQAVKVPVIVIGGITPETAERVLAEGKADFVGLGRQSITDPEYPVKLASGKREDIRPCIRCLTCVSNIAVEVPMSCAVNPRAGQELQYHVTPAARKKRVLVVGAGPGGMEAARVAASRGHDVTLCDEGNRLGGALLVLTVLREAKGGDLVADLTRYYQTQLRKLGVKLQLGRHVDAAIIGRMKPDVVIVATGGATPASPDIPGINNRRVVEQARLYESIKPFLRIFGPKFLRWMTNFYIPQGRKVAIIGGAFQSIEMADFLVKRGRKVTVTETSDELAAGMPDWVKTPLLESLRKDGCVMLAGVKYEEITDKGLTLITKEGERKTIEADTILPDLPLTPNTALFESLKGKTPEVYLIGDARQLNMITGSISEGFTTALAI